MKKRMLSQDIAKGLGILVVVQAHGLQLTHVLLYAVCALFGFVMPFFMFMSGYNYRKKGQDPVQAMKKRVGMILKTFLYWTLGTFVVMGVYFLIHGDGSVSEILRSFAAFMFS